MRESLGVAIDKERASTLGLMEASIRESGSLIR